MRDGYTMWPEARATASLMPLAVPFGDMVPGTAWLLTGIEVARESRGKGVARELMRRVLADADAEGVTLCLAVEPDGTGLDFCDLFAWYERLGFVAVDEDGGAMVRTPRVP